MTPKTTKSGTRHANRAQMERTFCETVEAETRTPDLYRVKVLFNSN